MLFPWIAFPRSDFVKNSKALLGTALDSYWSHWAVSLKQTLRCSKERLTGFVWAIACKHMLTSPRCKLPTISWKCLLGWRFQSSHTFQVNLWSLSSLWSFPAWLLDLDLEFGDSICTTWMDTLAIKVCTHLWCQVGSATGFMMVAGSMLAIPHKTGEGLWLHSRLYHYVKTCFMLQYFTWNVYELCFYGFSLYVGSMAVGRSVPCEFIEGGTHLAPTCKTIPCRFLSRALATCPKLGSSA